MYSASIWLAGALILSLFTAVGLAGLEITRPFIPPRLKVKHNDVSGSFATRMGTVYAALEPFTQSS